MTPVTYSRYFLYFCLVAIISVCGCKKTATFSGKDRAETEFLDDLQKREWLFFHEQRRPHSGLIFDRARIQGGPANEAASTASTGFGLAALCVAESRGWIDRPTALQQSRETIRFMLENGAHERGFFYHFLDPDRGTRIWESEVSPIDTALFLAGAITAREYFQDGELTRLVNAVRDRIDWQWMLNNGKSVALGWKPGAGFLPYRWDNYSEHMIMDLLGIGSPTNPLPPETWHAWKRGPVGTHFGMTFMECPPLFTHQYSQAFIDFRGKTDGHADYFMDSRYATLAQRAMCISMQNQFPQWGPNVWGLTACDSANGYKAWGGPPATTGSQQLDGTISAYAPGGSIPFAPAECIAALREMKRQWGGKMWGRYGFVNAFNPETGWKGSDVVGIDVGVTLLQAENYRTGLIWNTFMRAPEIQRAMKLAGFEPARELQPNSSLAGSGGKDSGRGQGVLKQAATNPGSDAAYLKLLMKETWSFLADHVDSRTGFPTDSQEPGGRTNTTNIGLYLASLGPAVDLGFLSREEGVQRARRVIESLAKLETRHGLLPNLISVEGDTQLIPGVSAISDFNKLITGLVLVRQFFPELYAPASALVDRVEWKWLYNGETGQGYFGFDLVNDQPVGPAKFWLAADTRTAVFFLIATGAAPAEFWDRMDRRTIETAGLSFYAPGYEWGGLFMQAMDGIFLDERTTEVGRSVADLAWHQIGFAEAHGLPVWGWSNCNIPNAGYTEGGFLPWWVVTPHASALVIDYYPNHVIANLRNLEAAGMRQPLPGASSSYGFRDSLNLHTKVCDNHYLALDQAMLFLSLANYVGDGMVRSHFAKDPLVAEGIRRLGKRLAPNADLFCEWKRRDALPSGAAVNPCQGNTGETKTAVLDLRNGGSPLEVKARVDSKKTSLKVTRTEKGIMIEYDLGPDGLGEADAILTIPPLDVRALKDVVISASGHRLDGKTEPFGMRIYLRDDQGQGQYAYIPRISEQITSFSLNETARLGFFAKPEALTEITIKLWGKPWFYSQQKTDASKGVILLDRLTFNAGTTR